jgi:hypothetical protein
LRDVDAGVALLRGGREAEAGFVWREEQGFDPYPSPATCTYTGHDHARMGHIKFFMGWASSKGSDLRPNLSKIVKPREKQGFDLF